MAYSTHNFSSGDTLYASQLNEMDAQIALNEETANSAVKSVNGVAPDDDGNVEVEVSGGSDYTLPTASADTKGGVMIGDGLEMDGETLNVNPYLDKYRLLKTIETGDSTDINLITVSEDEDGNTFSIRHLIIYAVMPNSTVTYPGRILINDIGSEAAFFSPFFRDNSYRLYVRMDILGNGQLLFAERSGGQNANMWASIDPTYSIHLPSDLGVNAIPDITKIRIYLNDSGVWPTDTTIYFYGY